MSIPLSCGWLFSLGRRRAPLSVRGGEYPTCTVQSKRPVRSLTFLPLPVMTASAGIMRWRSCLFIRREKIIVHPAEAKSSAQWPLRSCSVWCSRLSRDLSRVPRQSTLPHKLRGLHRNNLQREPIAAGALSTRPETGRARYSPFKWGAHPLVSRVCRVTPCDSVRVCFVWCHVVLRYLYVSKVFHLRDRKSVRHPQKTKIEMGNASSVNLIVVAIRFLNWLVGCRYFVTCGVCMLVMCVVFRRAIVCVELVGSTCIVNVFML